MLSDVLPVHSFFLADIEDLILDMTVNVQQDPFQV